MRSKVFSLWALPPPRAHFPAHLSPPGLSTVHHCREVPLKPPCQHQAGGFMSSHACSTVPQKSAETLSLVILLLSALPKQHWAQQPMPSALVGGWVKQREQRTPLCVPHCPGVMWHLCGQSPEEEWGEGCPHRDGTMGLWEQWQHTHSKSPCF